MIKTSRNLPQPTSLIPPDDLKRNLTLAQPEKNESLPHIGLVGDTYTTLLTGATRRAVFVSSICIFLLAAHLLIVTISRRHSSFWKARLRLHSAALNRRCERARLYIFRPTRRTSSVTHLQNRCGCCAFARQPAKRSSSRQSALRWRLGPRRRPYSTRRRRRSSERSAKRFPKVSDGDTSTRMRPPAALGSAVLRRRWAGS